MKTKAIIGGGVVIALLLFIAILLAAPRHPPQDITIRHIGSVHHSGDVTMLAFEITNHTSDRYFFHATEVQVREGNAWVKFRPVDQFPYKFSELAPRAAVSLYTVDVTNLPVGSAVRFKIRRQKALLGVNGFIRRAELDLKRGTGVGRRSWISLNPYDTNGSVWGLPTEVVSEEWLETAVDMFPYLNR